MVEMMEANQAIKRASSNSLILFDELGRGTATYDGMALAQSIIEYIHQNIGAKTLFATHYHELTSLSDSLTGLVNVHVATLEDNGEVTFLHKITQGPADKSYGIHVAKIAGLPNELLSRADVILRDLENIEQKPIKIDNTVNQSSELGQISLFESADSEIIEKIKSLDVYNMTPMQALSTLVDLKNNL